MFDLDQLIADCRAALAADLSHKLVREVVAKAVSDPTAVLRALGEPKRAQLQKLYQAQEKKHRHQGSIGSFYVRPQFRGRGVGDALMKAALEEAAKRVEHVTLTVTASNLCAVRLYERNGFTTVGRLVASIRVGGVDHDELSMHRRVSVSD